MEKIIQEFEDLCGNLAISGDSPSEETIKQYFDRYAKALQLLQPDVIKSVLFANWIVEKGYKLNNKPFVKGRDAVWFFNKKSIGSTTSELYKQYVSETVA